MGQTQNKKGSFLALIALIAMLFGFAFEVPIRAYAAGTEQTKTRAAEIIEHSFFFGYRKGEDSARGRYIVAMFYVPDTVYDSDCTYGVAIFPKRYMDRFDIHGDYLDAFAEQNVSILNVIGNSVHLVSDGKVYRLGIQGIREQNTNLEFTFVFYVTDKAGNTEYLLPQYACYNTLNASEMTEEEIMALLNREKGMRENFGQIVEKLSELADSVWIYLVIGASAIVIAWGVYIGIRIAIAKKNEEKINAKGMIKGLVIGIVIAFVLAGGLPLLIKGLSAWAI